MRDIDVFCAHRGVTVRIVRPYLIAILCCAGVGLTAGSAGAATYHDFLCRVPYGPNAGTQVATDALVPTLRSASSTTTQTARSPVAP